MGERESCTESGAEARVRSRCSSGAASCPIAALDPFPSRDWTFGKVEAFFPKPIYNSLAFPATQDGVYSMFVDQSEFGISHRVDGLSGYECRGLIRGDSRGRYELRTILPAAYWTRPQHIHAKIRVGCRFFPITTQLYFQNGQGHTSGEHTTRSSRIG